MARGSNNTQYKLSDVLALFRERDGYEPWTTREVGEELGSTRRTALNKLTQLEEENEVSSKRVGRGESGGRVWWRSAEVRHAKAAADPTIARAQIQTIQFPARTKAMLRERREAVRAAYDYLQEHQIAGATEIMEAVYEDHSAGYEKPITLWQNCLRPGLQQLGFDTPAPGKPWQFVGRGIGQTGLSEY
jgi:predicted ArsR family transcriptional regulator